MLPNPLASRWGRLMAFFFLYVTEGIPLGFTSTAMAVHLSKSGLSDLQVGIFTGWLYIPWSFKWLVGPVVDLVYSKRLGYRRTWILSTQIMMIGTLLCCIPIQMSSSNVQLLTAIIFIHNLFCATQDVAIDALACNVLREDERGLGNGLMFAGQTLGIPLGGACVLYLTNGLEFLIGNTWVEARPILNALGDGIPFGVTSVFLQSCVVVMASVETLRDGLPFGQTYFFVVGCILMVTCFVAWPMREEETERPVVDAGRLSDVCNRLAASEAGARYRLENSASKTVNSIVTKLGIGLIWLLLPRRVSTKTDMARTEIGNYLITAGQSFFGSRVAVAGLIFALLPAGAMGLNLALQKLLGVRLGMKDSEIADLEVVSSVAWAVSCVLGGVLSDRLGHLKCLAVFILMMSLPTLWLGTQMQGSGWTSSNTKDVVAEADEARTETLEKPTGKESPAEKESDEAAAKKKSDEEKKPRPRAPQRLVDAFWWAVMGYMCCQGLMYGTRTAVFMRISNPNVAATQFTAYMALMNLVIAYSAWWQGAVIEQWGYATTLYIDAAFGLVCISVLPFLRGQIPNGTEEEDLSPAGETEGLRPKVD